MQNRYQGFDYRLIQTVDKLMDLRQYIDEHHEIFEVSDYTVQFAVDVTYQIEVLVKRLQSF